MAGRLTLWGAGELLGNFFTGGRTLPEELYLALTLRVAPTPFVSGNELDEPLVGSYSRLTIPATDTFWSNTGQPHVIAVNRDLSFPVAVQAWGRVRNWALCSAPVGGNVYAYGDLEPMDIPAGETVILYAGDLTIAVGPFYTNRDA